MSIQRILVFDISQYVNFSYVFNTIFHFIHLLVSCYWNASGSLVLGKDSSQLMPILESVKCFKYGSCMIYCFMFISSIFLLCQFLWEGAFKMPLSCMDSQNDKPIYGYVVYLGIRPKLTNIFLCFFPCIHLLIFNFCGILFESSLFTVNCPLTV